MNEPTLGKAMTALEFLSQDAEARRQYEMRQKALHDEASMLEGARTEGEIKGKVEIARILIQMGMDITKVAQATGFSVLELEKLMQTH